MVSENAMLSQIIPSTEIYLKFIWNLSEIYQQRISKVIVLKLPTQVAMSSAFRKVPCT